MNRIMLFLIVLIIFSACTKEEESFQSENFLSQEQQLRNAHKDFLDVLSSLKLIPREELEKIIQSEEPLAMMEKYETVDRELLLQKATIFLEKLKTSEFNQKGVDAEELSKILIAGIVEGRTASIMGTPCYDTYERNFALASASLLICVYGSGSVATAGCLLVYGLTVNALDADFEACLKDKYAEQ